MSPPGHLASPPTEESADQRVVRRFPPPPVRDGGHPSAHLTSEGPSATAVLDARCPGSIRGFSSRDGRAPPTTTEDTSGLQVNLILPVLPKLLRTSSEAVGPGGICHSSGEPSTCASGTHEVRDHASALRANLGISLTTLPIRLRWWGSLGPCWLPC